MSDPDKDFENHLTHYGCKWCADSWDLHHQEMVEQNNQQKTRLQNLEGILRSYKMYQQALVKDIRLSKYSEDIHNKTVSMKNDRIDTLQREVNDLKDKLKLRAKRQKKRLKK